MQKLAPATEQFQHFVSNLRESFWGDLNRQKRGRSSWKQIRSGSEIGCSSGCNERNDERRRDYRDSY